VSTLDDEDGVDEDIELREDSSSSLRQKKKRRQSLDQLPDNPDAFANSLRSADMARLEIVDSVGLGDRRGCDECKELLEREQWLAL
jgi:hypothetical protein